MDNQIDPLAYHERLCHHQRTRADHGVDALERSDDGDAVGLRNDGRPEDANE